MWGWRRYGLLLPANALAMLAVAFWEIEDLADSGEIIPNLWVVLCAAGAVAVALVALFPRSRLLFRIAGPIAITALGTRPLGVLGNFLVGYTRSGWSVVVASIVYPSLALLVALWWFDRVGPWQVRHQVGAPVDGD